MRQREKERLAREKDRKKKSDSIEAKDEADMVDDEDEEKVRMRSTFCRSELGVEVIVFPSWKILFRKAPTTVRHLKKIEVRPSTCVYVRRKSEA